MVITQCDAHAPRRARVEELGIRIVNQYDTPGYRHMQLHPRDTGGSFFEIDEQLGERAHEPDGPWEPAGDDWHRFRRLQRVTGIVAAEMQCDDPAATAARWSEIAQIPLTGDGHQTLALENATLRFVACADGRPEGLGGIDVACADARAVLRAAEARDVRSGDRQVYLCGMRVNLV